MSFFEKGRVPPFSCGTQYLDWEASNCLRCKKNVEYNNDAFVCDIQEALATACLGDGYVSRDIAKRMGFFDNNSKGSFAYGWKCNEVVWTEEWKLEYLRRKERNKND